MADALVVDWEKLFALTEGAAPLAYTDRLPPAGELPPQGAEEQRPRVPIAVARDAAFCFTYAETLEALERAGAELCWFSPLQDPALPEQIGGLYLPGGYPENRLEELAGARLARESIRSYIEAGGRTLAECGGMIYLSQSVLSDGDTDGGGSDTDGRSTGNSVSNVGNEMVGVLPFSITNERKRRKLTLGYRRFDYNGWRLKGHEFHYTQLAVPEAGGKESGAYSLTPSIVQVFNARGEKVATPIFRYKNLIASYTHLYWGEMDVMSLFGGV